MQSCTQAENKSEPYRNKSDGTSTEGSSVGQTESITTCVTSSVAGEQKTKVSNSITSSVSVPSDKVMACNLCNHSFLNAKWISREY